MESKVVAVKTKKQNERPTLKHTNRGVLYAEPVDILSSEAAQKQLKMIRKSNFFKELKKHSHKQ